MKKITLLLLSLVCFSAFAQQLLPVNGNVVMPFPSPIFLFDYYATGSNDLQVTVQLNDLTKPSQQVKLQITIDDGTVLLETKQNYQPLTPIVLSAGMPQTLMGSDLFDALNVNNLNLSGISAAYLNANAGKLPEGQYNFCVTVLDYNTGKPLSNPSCASVFLQLEQPPIIVSPTCESRIKPSTPQVVRFNWQLAGGGQPSLTGFNTYELELYQIMDTTGTDYQNAVINSKAVEVYRSGATNLNNLTLDFSTVLLVPGEKYVYRIKASGPQGKETFQNNGYSEWCWFSYGYPTNGVINIQAPFEGKQFNKTEQKVFNWDVSDKGTQGQPYDYKIKIVELNDTSQSLADALINNTPFHEETLPTTTTQDGGNFLLNKALTPDKKYAWQITVTSTGQVVAESTPQSFYSHSLIEKFYASNQEIKIVQITNPDLNNLAGKARILLSNDSTDYKDVNFSGLKMREVSGKLILNEGSIPIDLSGRDELDIQPEIADNGPGKFEYVSAIIDKTGLKVDGKIKWTIPHSVKAGEEDEVISQLATFTMNSNGELSGENGIQAFSTILMDPKDFELELKPTSLLQLSDNVFKVRLFGSVTLPSEIKSKNGQPIKVEFKNQQDQLNYIQINNLIGAVSSGLAPIDDFDVEFIPIQGGIIDFSEEQSPDKLSADKSWKGFYVTGYKTRLKPSGFDASNQLKIPQQYDFDTTTSNTGNKFWVDRRGLTLKTSFELKDEDGVTFNEFQSDIKGIVDINRSVFNNVKIEGSTLIPFLDDKNDFTFDILATEQGLEEGFLNQDLTQLDLVFNPYGGENRMELTINRAVFVDNNRLSLNIDVEIPELAATISGIEDFRVYGDYFIGVEGKNQSKTLDNFVNGTFKDLVVKITDFGGAFLGGKYALSYMVETNLGPGITGANGPPKMVINSVVNTDVQLTTAGDAVSPTLEVPDSLDPSNSKIEPNRMEINIQTAVADAYGFISYVDNSPEWGTKFQGGIAVTLKKPGEIDMGANIVLGVKGDKDYWYFDAYFEDKDGTGVSCGAFYMTAFEGKIYSNMKAKADAEGNFSIELDPTIRFGIAAYTQILDKSSKGFNWQLDGGLEIEFTGPAQGTAVDNLVVRVSAEMSFLNTNGVRSDQVGNITKSVKEEAIKQVEAFAIDQVFPQSFDLAGTNVTIDAKSLKEGSLSIGDWKGGSGFEIGGNVTATPSFNIGFATSGFTIGGSADAEGSGSLKFGVGSIDIDGTLENSTKGSFSMDIGDFATSFGADMKLNKMNFGFDYKSDVSLALDIDGSANSGGFDIDILGTRFLANADALAQTAAMGFEINNNKFDMSYDGNAGAGSLVGDFSGLQFNTNFDKSAGKGLFQLSTSSADVDAEGSSDGAKFEVEEGSTKFQIESDFNANTGRVNLEFPNNQLTGQIGNDFASVFMKSNSLEIGANGSFSGTSGALHLKEGNFLLDVVADADSSAGGLDFQNGSISFNSKYNLTDSSYIKYKDGADFKEAILTDDYHKAHYKVSGEEFMLEQNSTNATGKFLYAVPQFSFGGEFDPNNQFASTNILIDGDKDIEAYFKQDTSAINYKNGLQTFNVFGVDGGNGFVKFNDEATGISTGFGYDKTTSAGNIYYKNGNFVLDLAGNNTDASGNYEFKDSGYEFKGSFKDSLYSFNQVGDIIIEAIAQDSGVGIRYANNGDKIKLFENNNGATLDWNLGGVSLAVAEVNDEFKAKLNSGGIDISTETTADKAEFSYDDGSYEVNGVVNSSNDDLKFNYKNGSDSLRLDNSGKEGDYIIALSAGSWSANLLESIADDTANFTFNKGGDEIKMLANSTQELLGLKVGNFQINGGTNNNQDYINTTVGNVAVSIADSVNVAVDNVTVNLVQNAQSQDVIQISIGSDNYELVPAQGAGCSFDFIQNGSVAALVNGALSLTLSGGNTLATNQSSDGQDVTITTSGGTVFNAALSCSETPVFSITESGSVYSFQLKQTETLINIGNYTYKRNDSNGDIELVNGNDKFILTDTELDIEVSDYKLLSNSSEFIAEKGDFKISADATKAGIELGDKLLELREDESYTIQLATDQKIISSPTSLTVENGTQKLTADAANFKVEETAESFVAEVKPNEVVVTQGSYSYSSKDTEVKMTHNSDHFTVNTNTVSAKYGSKEFDIASDQSVSFKNGTQTYSVDENSLDITYDGTELKVLADKVQVNLAGNGVIEASDKQLKYNKDAYNILLDKIDQTPDFSYTDGSNALNLGAAGLSLDINGNKVIANNTKLEIESGSDKLLLTDNDLDFKYSNYEAEFTDWNDARISNGTQEFKVEADQLTATLDADNKIRTYMASNNAPAIQFTVDGDDYDVRTDGAEFDYAGQHFSMNTSEYLRVYSNSSSDSTEGLYIDNQGLRYKLGGTELVLGSDSALMQMNLGQYALSYTASGDLAFGVGNYVTTLGSDMSASFTDGNHLIRLNDDSVLTGYSNGSGLQIAFKDFGQSMYGIQAGTSSDYMFVKSKKGEALAFGGDILGSGLIEFTTNQAKDLGIKYPKGASNIDMTIEKGDVLKNLNINIAGTEIIAYDPFGPLQYDSLNGIGNVEMNGPAHISKITESAGGWARGGVKIQMTLGSKFEIVVNGALTSGYGTAFPFLCSDMTFGYTARKGYFLFKLAEANDRADFSLICTAGLGDLLKADGYARLEYENKEGAANIDADAGLRFSVGFDGAATVNVKVLGVGCEIGLGLDIGASFDFEAGVSVQVPTDVGGSTGFQLRKIIIGLDAHAAIYAVACGKRIDLVGVAIGGKLGMEEAPGGTRYFGEAYGKVKVGPMSKGFKFDADFTI